MMTCGRCGGTGTRVAVLPARDYVLVMNCGVCDGTGQQLVL